MPARKSEPAGTPAKKASAARKPAAKKAAGAKAAAKTTAARKPAAKKTEAAAAAAKKPVKAKAARPAPARVPGRKERRGVVVSSAMDKTIVVRIDTVRRTTSTARWCAARASCTPTTSTTRPAWATSCASSRRVR